MILDTYSKTVKVEKINSVIKTTNAYIRSNMNKILSLNFFNKKLQKVDKPQYSTLIHF